MCDLLSEKISFPYIIFFQFYFFKSFEVTLGKTRNGKFGLLIKQNHS